MDQHHEKNLKSILQKSEADFKKWLESLSDEELIYVEWLLGKSEDSLDEILIEQSNLTEAKEILNRIMAK